MIRSLSGSVSLVPTVALAAASVALAWRERGSVEAEDWLLYALGISLLAATVLASGTAWRLSRGQLAGVSAFVALALWTALSASWSPLPSLARDEALLVLFYALVLTVPLLTLRSWWERTAAIVIVVTACVALVVVTSVQLITADTPVDLYWTKRLAWPIGYPGAETAIFLVSFWPAAALAASRTVPIALRTFAFAGAVALLAGWLMTQSRAGAVALGASAIVLFALAPARLRLLLPVGLAAALAGALYHPLTEPFRAEELDIEGAIRDAGRWVLVLSVTAVAVGLVYTLADRRFAVPARLSRAAGAVALAAVVLGLFAGMGAFLVAVDKPGDYLSDRWHDFKREPDRETGSSHLVTFGSNRYDLWRVALGEFREHPVAGGGGRAFGPAYLRGGRTEETPQRGHSLELDLLSETGILGFALLVAALAPFTRIVVRRARSDLVAAGALGGLAYWLIHASGDWTWTFPAAGLPFFLLLGSAAAGGETRRMGTRAAIVSAAALTLAALLAFAPPWLSARYTARALEQGPAAAERELRWARRLDPLSVEPLVAEAELAPSPAEAIAPLKEAVERESRSVAPRYLLGVAYLEAARPAEGRRELRAALRLSPRSEAVRQALQRAEDAGRGN